MTTTIDETAWIGSASNGRAKAAATVPVVLRVVDALSESEIAQLAEILIAVVAEGASVGFLAPLVQATATAYWQRACQAGTVLLVAERDGRIAGTAQLQRAESANGQHRAEVCKVLVSPDCRRRGIARQLMSGLEAVAREQGQTLLVLDTREGDPSNDLYRSVGYIEAGRVPGWARSSDGAYAATVFWYKPLGEALSPQAPDDP